MACDKDDLMGIPVKGKSRAFHAVSLTYSVLSAREILIQVFSLQPDSTATELPEPRKGTKQFASAAWVREVLACASRKDSGKSARNGPQHMAS